jgi:hypothetical protein
MPMPEDLLWKNIHHEFPSGCRKLKDTDFKNGVVVGPYAAGDVIVDAAAANPTLGRQLTHQAKKPFTVEREVYVAPIAAPGHPLGALGGKWRFNYLSYHVGYVTTAPVDLGTLTGHMGGCFLFKYKENGKTHMAHVGTGMSDKDDGTIKAKEAWRQFAQRREVTDISGIEPFTPVQTLMLKYSAPGKVAICLGYFSAAGRGYSILAVPAVENMRAHPVWKIVHIQEIFFSSWDVIKEGPSFRGAI